MQEKMKTGLDKSWAAPTRAASAEISGSHLDGTAGRESDDKRSAERGGGRYERKKRQLRTSVATLDSVSRRAPAKVLPARLASECCVTSLQIAISTHFAHPPTLFATALPSVLHLSAFPRSGVRSRNNDVLERIPDRRIIFWQRKNCVPRGRSSVEFVDRFIF